MTIESCRKAYVVRGLLVPQSILRKVLARIWRLRINSIDDKAYPNRTTGLIGIWKLLAALWQRFAISQIVYKARRRDLFYQSTLLVPIDIIRKDKEFLVVFRDKALGDKIMDIFNLTPSVIAAEVAFDITGDLDFVRIYAGLDSLGINGIFFGDPGYNQGGQILWRSVLPDEEKWDITVEIIRHKINISLVLCETFHVVRRTTLDRIFNQVAVGFRGF